MLTKTELRDSILPIFNEGEFFAGDFDDWVRFGASGGEFGAYAHFLHDIAKPVDAGVVIKIGAAGKFFYLFAGNFVVVIV